MIHTETGFMILDLHEDKYVAIDTNSGGYPYPVGEFRRACFWVEGQEEYARRYQKTISYGGSAGRYQLVHVTLTLTYDEDKPL